MLINKEIFKLFDRDNYVYQAGDEKTKNEYVEKLEHWNSWCDSLASKESKFDTPIKPNWQNSGSLAKYFWTRLKYIPFTNSASCVGLFISSEELTISVGYELKNEKSELSREEFNKLIMQHLNEWVASNNVDTDLYILNLNDDENKCTIKQYFNDTELQKLFNGEIKKTNISVGVEFSIEQIDELDSDSEGLIKILKNLSSLYEKVQKPNEFYNKLKNAEELVPDQYDGSYRLVRETVAAYKSVSYESININDLDAVFYMSVGTFRRSMASKKELVNKSNLPDSEKNRIIHLMDEIEGKAKHGEYSNQLEGIGSVGMFGVGFMTFQKGDADANIAKKFIKLCIDINDSSDEEEIYKITNEVLSKNLKGIGVGSASTFLHCLKPFTFPILNGRMGEGTQNYDALGIKFKNPKDIKFYIENAKIIKSYRDKYFDFKNFRLFDLLNLDEKNDEIKEGAMDLKNKSEIEGKKLPRNLILYGPPGTGKTYDVINKALEAIDPVKYDNLINDPTKRKELVSEYNNLVNKGQIAFCTFHQSYSYEEFIEGLRSDDNGNFTPRDGIFKQICQSAKSKETGRITSYDFNENQIKFHKMSLVDDSSGDDSIFDYCIENNKVAIGWGGAIDYSDCNDKAQVRDKFLAANPDKDSKDFNIDAITRFKTWLNKGDIILVGSGNHKIRAIAKVTGDYSFNQNADISFCHFRDVEWLFSGDPIPVNQFLKNKALSQQTIYTFYKTDLIFENIRDLISSNVNAKGHIDNYVLIIDEINRGSISKIFGELITLIEADKRQGEKNELTAILPYSNDVFSVPSNLYIIGTMNTADRSIALLDTALRRRFNFIECMPKPELIIQNVQGIDVSKLLSTINQRVEFLLDRDHTIGHSYFMDENLDLNGLKEIMTNKIIPLLQEYFYDNWEHIERILGGAGKNGDSNYFLTKEEIQPRALFGDKLMDDLEPRCRYSIVKEPTLNAFLNVYENIG